MCWLLAANLALLTAGVAAYYVSEEPFPILALPSEAEEAYELMRFVYAFTYFGLGALTVLGWGGLAFLLHRTFSTRRAVARLLVAASLLAMGLASWTPLAYYRHPQRVQHRGEHTRAVQP